MWCTLALILLHIASCFISRICQCLAKTVIVEVNNIKKSKDTSSFKHFLLDDFWLLAKGWMVQGQNRSGGGEIFCTLRVALETTHSPVQWVPGPFPRDEAARCGVDHPPTSSTEFKERVELYLYSASRSSRPILGCALPLFYVLAWTVQIANFKYYYSYNLKIPRLNPPASPGIWSPNSRMIMINYKSPNFTFATTSPLPQICSAIIRLFSKYLQSKSTKIYSCHTHLHQPICRSWPFPNLMSVTLSVAICNGKKKRS